MPAVAAPDPKYVGDVWIVEHVNISGYQGESLQLGVFDTLEAAEKFSNNIGHPVNHVSHINKIAYYTTKWSDTNEE